MGNRLRDSLSYTINFFLILLAWQALSSASRGILPGPVETLQWMVSKETLSSIAYNTLITLRNAVLGFSLALILAISTALLSRLNGILDSVISSFNVYVQSISALIWILVFLVLFGFKSPVPPILVTTGIAYPILLSSLLGGIKSVDHKIVELAELFGATKKQLFSHIYIPASIPYTIAGSRAALGAALRISVVAEAFGSSGGIGYKLTYYFDLYNYKGMMAWALLLVVLMVLLDKLVLEPVEKWSERWLP
ncbi:MAG: ABC transporter permease subunit [Desulfurococcales archaeon]|nr:ABC transporter permease subunit [Desulfurococcales archaeon]